MEEQGVSGVESAFHSLPPLPPPTAPWEALRQEASHSPLTPVRGTGLQNVMSATKILSSPHMWVAPPHPHNLSKKLGTSLDFDSPP